MNDKTVVVIGAGPGGLTAAHELIGAGRTRVIVLEASDAFGGISKTVNYKGNRIDIGGHRFFSKSDRVMEWWFHFLPLQATGVVVSAGDRFELPGPAGGGFGGPFWRAAPLGAADRRGGAPPRAQGGGAGGHPPVSPPAAGRHATFGGRVIPQCIISMTRGASDMLELALLLFGLPGLCLVGLVAREAMRRPWGPVTLSMGGILVAAASLAIARAVPEDRFAGLAAPGQLLEFVERGHLHTVAMPPYVFCTDRGRSTAARITPGTGLTPVHHSNCRSACATSIGI